MYFIVHAEFVCIKLMMMMMMIRPFRAFKVTDIGISRKTICDFLLVVNSN